MTTDDAESVLGRISTESFPQLTLATSDRTQGQPRPCAGNNSGARRDLMREPRSPPRPPCSRLFPRGRSSFPSDWSRRTCRRSRTSRQMLATRRVQNAVAVRSVPAIRVNLSIDSVRWEGNARVTVWATPARQHGSTRAEGGRSCCRSLNSNQGALPRLAIDAPPIQPAPGPATSARERDACPLGGDGLGPGVDLGGSAA